MGAASDDVPLTESAGTLRARLEEELRAAEQADDRTRAAALQSAVLAIDNVAAALADGDAVIADVALADGEVVHRAERGAELDEGVVTRVLANEIAQRREAAQQYREAGDDEHAERSEREIAVLRAHVDGD